MRLTVFAIVILLAIASDVYIWASFLRGALAMWQVLHFLPTLCLVGLMLFIALHGGSPRQFQATFLLLLVFLLPKLLFMLCSLAGRIIALWLSPALGVMNAMGVCLATAVSLCACYGIVWGWKHLVVRPQTVVCETLPAELDGFKIVQLSDLHLETFAADEEFIRHVVETANLQHADLIVLTGDLVSRQSRELRPFMDILSRLKARYGVVSILGNHDYAIYGPLRTDKQACMDDTHRLVDMQRHVGWHVLLNENLLINQNGATLAVVGVENEGNEGGVHRARLQEAMADVPAETFTLLLSHDPYHWRSEVLPDTDIPLTLSGHTHAAHFRIGKFSLAHWFSGKEWAGLYREGNQQIFVSAGIGGMLPFRFGAWPEVNVITLLNHI